MSPYLGILFAQKRKYMNNRDIKDANENPIDFDIKKFSVYYISNLLKNGTFIANSEFFNMIEIAYIDCGKSLDKEIEGAVRAFLRKEGVRKKSIKKIENQYHGDWNRFFRNISEVADMPIYKIKKLTAELIRTKIILEIVVHYDLKDSNLINKRACDIKSFFCLSDIQIQLVVFSIIISESPLLSQYVRELSDLDRRKAMACMINTSSSIVIDELLSTSKLKSFAILDERNFVSEEIKEYIMSVGKSFISKSIKTEYETENVFGLESFDVPEISKNIILGLLKSDTPCKILLYGKAGAGKTEFAKSLIQASGNGIATPVFQEDNEDENKFKKCAMAEFISHKLGKVVLIDECDNIISSRFGFLYRKNTDKGDINKSLDLMKGKSIWITNSIDTIEDSTLRRFTYSVEFEGLSKVQKMTSLKTALSATEFSEKINAEELYSRLDRYSLSTAGIALAVNSANIVAKNSASGEIFKTIEAVAKSQSILLNGKAPEKVSRYKPDTHFDSTIINMDIPYGQLMNTLKNYDKKLKDKLVNCPMNLIFAGVAGSGKTELAKHIAYTFDKKIVLKNMSDLQSMLVGETEKNIARAFSEAEKEEAILVIDEADSLFIDRQTANRSWEVSQTNEILAQMENYRGIFICSTNLLENIDSAAMRRFQKKITFGYLEMEARKKLFRSYFLTAETELSADTIFELEYINNLIAGDFKNIYQQIQFDDISHSQNDFIEMLKRETMFKKNSPAMNRIGFCG